MYCFMSAIMILRSGERNVSFKHAQRKNIFPSLHPAFLNSKLHDIEIICSIFNIDTLRFSKKYFILKKFK